MSVRTGRLLLVCHSVVWSELPPELMVYLYVSVIS